MVYELSIAFVGCVCERQRDLLSLILYILNPSSWNDCCRVALWILIPSWKSHHCYANLIHLLGNAGIKLFDA